MDKEIFSLVSREDEKIKLWNDLAQAHAEILCKGKAESVCRVKSDKYQVSNHALECSIVSSTLLADGEEYLAYFFIGGEKYYFQGTASFVKNKLSIPLPKELWHLQRRQNYRVKIPDGYAAYFNIVDVGGIAHKIHGQLADLSSQGCRVIYKMDNPQMKISDNVTGHLIIGNRPEIPIQGIVRHIKIDDGNKMIQTFGIEFTPLPTIIENKLFALTMEIHKQIFRRPT